MPVTFVPDTPDARVLHLVAPDDLSRWRDSLPKAQQTWVEASGFSATAGALCLLPGETGEVSGAAFGLGDRTAQARTRFAVAAAVGQLPEGPWRLSGTQNSEDAAEQALGWLLAGYRFTQYAGGPRKIAQLIAPEGVDAARVEAMAAGEALTRDLINTPSNDMGPDELEQAARDLAGDHGAQIDVTKGDDLLTAGFPMIHAVGRASPREPRLIDMSWGSAGPTLTLVGKGVCFDTGGLNLKPGGSMGLMKKDMGGAAAVLGLAHAIMSLKLPFKLRVLIPAVENAVSGSAFRPGDILRSRKGLSVEINNTDAEGRLVLADALALADETPPDLMVSMATLTGAARVAVGPDIAPFFTHDAGTASALAAAGSVIRDPVWQMPLHAPYEPMLEPGIADLDNAPSGGFAGSITAALFLNRFVTDTPRYVHFDIYGWQPSPAPARPKGGAGQGVRAILHALPGLLDAGGA
ncbi:leucyl aminopeptidase family protein [Meridianimarinicoccus aquatilis]|uniref:Leucyl aminopeptidase family protein n=1 Tax=Meridianimarinicoccus aquatilis TaxID=2552766 RepID=A0A4R6ATX9_9RHOB|nr:leucyl aminopeptidase family protein [Fluviibacterium aquatile]TDL86994.1 leucyl aminopeptidase family protein [Fluviibacterium aquatile]